MLAVQFDLAPASTLAPRLQINGEPGFVVADMTDVDEFAPIPSVALPDARTPGRFHDALFDEVMSVIADMAPGKDRLAAVAATYLDDCLRDRGVKALLLEARGHLPIADEVMRRNRMNVGVVAADFEALGAQHHRASAIPGHPRGCGSRRRRSVR